MKAIVWTAYGPPEVLQLQEIEQPVPKENEILVKIHAATVTAGDCEARRLQFPPWFAAPMRLYAGFRKPTRIKILGQELSGEIEAVGKDVTRFKVGDQVFAGLGFGMGAYAQYTTLPEDSGDDVVALKPAGISYEEAATIPTGGLESLHFLRKADIKNDERVLINGAGGSIGTYGVQLAKMMGAEVTAVDSGEKLDMLLELGADHVIDYTKDDFSKSGQTYDVIFDVVGKSDFSRSVQSLGENGRYVLANPWISAMVRGGWTSMRSDKNVIFGAAGRETEDLVYLADLMAAGRLKAVIDRRYPLEETAEAHRYVETGRKNGNLVITVGH